jgi:hypothetical protein
MKLTKEFANIGQYVMSGIEIPNNYDTNNIGGIFIDGLYFRYMSLKFKILHMFKIERIYPYKNEFCYTGEKENDYNGSTIDRLAIPTDEEINIMFILVVWKKQKLN